MMQKQNVSTKQMLVQLKVGNDIIGIYIHYVDICFVYKNRHIYISPNMYNLKIETTSTKTPCSDDKYICCNGYKKSECYVDYNIDEPDVYCDWQFDEFDGLGCPDDTFACPDDGTAGTTEISRNDCCQFMHSQCCIIECEEGTYYGYYDILDDDTDTATCIYKEYIEKDDGTVDWKYIETPTCES